MVYVLLAGSKRLSLGSAEGFRPPLPPNLNPKIRGSERMWYNSLVTHPRFKVKSTKSTGINTYNGHSTKLKTSNIRFLDVEPKILY